VPKVAILANCSVHVYADDHPPPHFHVPGPDVNAVVDLRTLAVVRGRVNRSDIAEAIAWAREHLDVIEATWRKLNERD
jgi:hypothetical protein